MSRTWNIRLAMLLLLLANVLAWSDERERLRVTVLSSRADMVSGGDALVRLEAADTSGIQVRLNDLDISPSGIDIDAEFIPSRIVGDRSAIRAGYETGRILYGGAGLAEVPIIDYRGYSDLTKGDIHMQFTPSRHANAW